jgi:hypothetical protein
MDILRRFWKTDAAGSPGVLQLFTPNIVGPDKPGLRLVVGGLTLVGLGVASMLAISSFLTMLGAIAGIYLLLTQVLGLELDFDPRAFVEEARRYAAAAQAHN